MVEVALATISDGRLDLLGTNGLMTWHTSQKQAGSIAWNKWAPISGLVPATHIAAATDGSGRFTTVIVDPDGNAWLSQRDTRSSGRLLTVDADTADQPPIRSRMLIRLFPPPPHPAGGPHTDALRERDSRQ